mgnify:CR=1 FL=1
MIQMKRLLLIKLFYEYFIDRDVQMMLDAIEETRGTGKRSADVFIGRLYPEEEYRKYQKVDTIY